MKNLIIAVLGIMLLITTQNIFAQIADRETLTSTKIDTFPRRDTIRSMHEIQLQKQKQQQREEYNRERQKLEREREKLERQRERLNHQRDSLDRKYAGILHEKKKSGVDSTAKAIGHKGAKLGAKAVSSIKDRSLENVKGPKGETVYVDKYDRRYYIDESGKRVYLKKPKTK